MIKSFDDYNLQNPEPNEAYIVLGISICLVCLETMSHYIALANLKLLIFLVSLIFSLLGQHKVKAGEVDSGSVYRCFGS